jgi:hypothetical protein
MHILHDDDCFSDYQECQHQERGTASLNTDSGWHFPSYQKKKKKKKKTKTLGEVRKKRKDTILPPKKNSLL